MAKISRNHRLILWSAVAVSSALCLWHILFTAFERAFIAPEMLTISEIQRKCHIPDMDPNNPLLLKYVKDVGELKCDTEPDWLETKGGLIHIDTKAVKRHGRVQCQLVYFKRVDDFTTKVHKKATLTSKRGAAVPESDFFYVDCKAADGKTWSNLMAGICRNETVVQLAMQKTLPRGATGLNVLVFGLHSMSRLHFIRKLPKTYRYLTEVLKGTVLKGYNIVGDSTQQALIPILTGWTEPELAEARKRFLWNNFRNAGYVTAYGNDSPSAETHRLKGFDAQPTDHYMRPFYLEVDKVRSKHLPYCLRNIPRHKVMLNWLRQFYDVYHDVLKFAFLFHGELSHDDYNAVGYMDADLEAFLQDLHLDGILNNTLLIVMSDHGHKFPRIRAILQGKLEERLPFFSITVPPWMERKFPDAVRSLRTNSERLTTPFDIHSTLLAVLFPAVPKLGDTDKRNISLFSEVPEERTCGQAAIELRWCACLEWTTIPPSNPLASRAARAVVAFINQLTSGLRKACEQLDVAEVFQAVLIGPNTMLMRYPKDAGLVEDRWSKAEADELLIQVQLMTFPGLALYDASLVYDVKADVLGFDEAQISRINHYGDQDHCIRDDHPELRKYCYCVHQQFP